MDSVTDSFHSQEAEDIRGGHISQNYTSLLRKLEKTPWLSLPQYFPLILSSSVAELFF